MTLYIDIYIYIDIYNKEPKTMTSKCKPTVPGEVQHHCEIYDKPNKILKRVLE